MGQCPRKGRQESKKKVMLVDQVILPLKKSGHEGITEELGTTVGPKDTMHC